MTRAFQASMLIYNPDVVFILGEFLMLSTLGKIFSRQHFEIFSYFSQKSGFDISINGDNLHELSNPVFLLIFPRKLTFHAIGDNLHEISNPVFWEK